MVEKLVILFAVKALDYLADRIKHERAKRAAEDAQLKAATERFKRYAEMGTDAGKKTQDSQ